VTGDLLLGLLVEDDVEEEDEDTLKGVKQREDDSQPLGAVGEVREPEDPRKTQDAEKREGSCNSRLCTIKDILRGLRMEVQRGLAAW